MRVNPDTPELFWSQTRVHLFIKEVGNGGVIEFDSHSRAGLFDQSDIFTPRGEAFALRLVDDDNSDRLQNAFNADSPPSDEKSSRPRCSVIGPDCRNVPSLFPKRFPA